MNVAQRRRRLSGQIMEGLDEKNLDVRHAIALNSQWRNSIFVDCNFRIGNFGNATFENSTFLRCDFSQSILVARLIECQFQDCDFDDANFSGAEIRGCTFADGTMQYSKWERATVIDTAFSTNLHGADLDLAEGRRIDWRGSNLWNARIPLGCAFFAGSQIDEREENMFLSLLCETKGELDRTAIEAAINPLQRKAVMRLVRGSS